MFNLIMRYGQWENAGHATISLGRMFEYTEERLATIFQDTNNIPLLDRLAQMPCLFMQEGREDEVARVGSIFRARIVNGEVEFEYSLDPEVPPLLNRNIYLNRLPLHMPHDFEFSRNHWAIKDVDLFRFLLRSVRPRRQRPTVFNISEHENIEPTLASAMMPFNAEFNQVYDSIREASHLAGLRCRRADDIWENAAIIQDVVALIDRSRIVICDCTGRNPNVFYEAGIAHTLGREVILITQSDHDIPFDLRHLRYIRYLNNNEGLATLIDNLQARMATILGG